MTYHWDIRYEAFLSLDRVYLQISLEETSSNSPCDDSNDYSCLFYYGDSWSCDFISVVAARKNEEHGSQVPWPKASLFFLFKCKLKEFNPEFNLIDWMEKNAIISHGQWPITK